VVLEQIVELPFDEDELSEDGMRIEDIRGMEDVEFLTDQASVVTTRLVSALVLSEGGENNG
jgi:hypothetical protein